jgi:hypothetical protein
MLFEPRMDACLKEAKFKNEELNQLPEHGRVGKSVCTSINEL